MSTISDKIGLDVNIINIRFHISGRIRIRIRIVSTISGKIGLDVNIINIRFKYSNTDKYWMLNIRTQIQTDLNFSKQIRS